MRHFRALVQTALVISAVCGLTTDFAKAQPANWTQVGMLSCKLNPSIGFVIFGHQSMECRFTQNERFPPQAYEGALNTVGIDIRPYWPCPARSIQRLDFQYCTKVRWGSGRESS